MSQERGRERLVKSSKAVTVKAAAGVIALTPRQVLLSNRPSMTSNKNHNNSNKDDDANTRFLRFIVAKYLKDNGFSKSLKKFLKESHLKEDDLVDDSVNLEQVYYKYLKTCGNGAKNSGVQVDKGKDKKDKKKKKNKLVSESTATRGEQHPMSTNGTKEEKLKKHASSEGKNETDTDEGNILKAKKKKNNQTSDTHVDSVKHSTENLLGIGSENLNDVGKSEDNGFTTYKKDRNSNKRKRKSSGENDLTLVNGETSKRSKCIILEDQQNPENLDQPCEKNATLSSDEPSPHKMKHVSGKTGLETSKKTPIKELDRQDNRKNEKSELKSASQKTSKKQEESSVEPKTVNVFQRVKVDKVVFTDERLQDNSYWAKGGAESGYGAKAQEILGQVRGRDFRHEKTKKKRGSYRGGQIDLQTHSIKFNYSDED